MDDMGCRFDIFGNPRYNLLHTRILDAVILFKSLDQNSSSAN